jgi:hypothetical protein|tara:strand:+ start:9513 stop:9980 length:468 start_codon:yes stop_codon:yes gene_type:complete
MDIWISKAKRTATCSHCKQPIDKGSPAVYGRLWKKRVEDGVEARHFVLHFYWHVSRPEDEICCWLEQGLEYLEQQQRQFVETRGKWTLGLNDEDKVARLKLLQRRAKIIARIRFEMLLPVEEREIEKMIELGREIVELKEQIAPLGGVPKGWDKY